MSNLRDTDWRRLADYLAGELSPEEAAATQQWLDGDPRRRVLAERLHAAWDEAAAARRDPVDVDGLIGVVQGRLAEAGDSYAARAAQIGVPRARWSRWPVVAAAVAAVFALATIGAVRMWRATERGRTPRYATYRTHAGQVAHLTLPDGSRLTLAPNSTLGIARDFGSARDVTLTGEAYFDVAPDTRAPFVVHTRGVTTRVLGTAFDIQRYATDAAVRVTVVSGKVMVHGLTPERASVTLTAGMTGLVTDSSAVSLVAEDVPSVRWIDGQLMFHKAPTTDVLAALTRWYGYRFQLADSSLATRNLTIVLTTESSSAALASLKLMLDVDLTFQDSLVTLHPRRAEHTAPRPARERRSPRDDFSTPQIEVGR